MYQIENLVRKWVLLPKETISLLNENVKKRREEGRKWRERSKEEQRDREKDLEREIEVWLS